MTAKEYLSRAYRLDELIKSDLRSLSELRELVTALPNTDYSGMPHSGGGGDTKLVNIISKIDELEKKVNAEIDKYCDIKNEIRDTICNVANMNFKLLLNLRYMNYLSWDEIALKMGYSVRNVYMLHGNALVCVDKILHEIT